MAKYRGVVKAGRLEVGGVVFTMVPALYELSDGEASKLRQHWGRRLTLDLMEDPPEISEDDQAITGPSAPRGQVLPPKAEAEAEKQEDKDPDGHLTDPEPEVADGVEGAGEPGEPYSDSASQPDAENYDCPECNVRHKRESGIGQQHAHLVTEATGEAS